MTRRSLMMVIGLMWWLAAGSLTHAAEVLLPAGLSTCYTRQPLELAVAGLSAGESVELTLTPAGAAQPTLTIPVVGPHSEGNSGGGGGTVIMTLPAYALAPGSYAVALAGKPQLKLTIARGAWPSTLYVGQTGGPNHGLATFHLTNAFDFGIAAPDGTAPHPQPRSRGRYARWEQLVASELPAILYMYWTGYVLHKPWGIHKEWASADMIENMRLFNFHIAQRMRRFDHLLISIGSLDEPGLPWGRTPAGGSASGFTGWNVAQWMAQRGQTWTDDPGSLSDPDFRTYMQLRARMLREAFEHASADIKTVWPTAVYATDAYAPQAVGDGTDPMNQTANDIPTTHVFADYGIGKLGVLAGLYVEKAHDPTSKVAHAMNGQLFGARVPQPQSRYAYHLMQNVLLAAGLDSNWWLNYGGMAPDDLTAVNEPAQRVGPLFVEMSPRAHDVAVLWSTTEIWLRVKDVMRREAVKKTGEQIALMVADLPEGVGNADGSMNVNAYNIGGNYKGEVLATHMALSRAGYPAHILHEDRLASMLQQYKVLVMVHQTFPLPAEKQQALTAWIAGGGTLLLDESSTVQIPGAVRFAAPSLVNQGYQWSARFEKAAQAQGAGARDASYATTNHFMESFSRTAAPLLGQALASTKARQVLRADTTELACERHVGGEGSLVMVINGCEKLPADRPDDQPYDIWNYAPYAATYTLPQVQPGEVVYCIEGLDWRTVSQIKQPTEPQSVSFAPGEMKLYLVAPRAPKGLHLKAEIQAGVLHLTAALDDLCMPWPLTVQVRDPAEQVVVSLYRATDAQGHYHEAIPLGMSAPAEVYRITLTSPVAGLHAQAQATQPIGQVQPRVIAEPVRVFDQDAIAAFLAGKPALTVVVGQESQQAPAQQLAQALQAAGIPAVVKPEHEVVAKALYPRVWDPYAPVHHPTATLAPLPEVTVRNEQGQVSKQPGHVLLDLLITSAHYDTPTVTTAAGEPFAGNWRTPGTQLTVVGQGFIDTSAGEQFIEPGVKLFVGDQNRLHYRNSTVEQTKTDAAFRARWARPWRKIQGHVGGFNLTPQLPEVYTAADHLILLGDSHAGTLPAALQASELLTQVVDEQYPGPGKALLQFVWSPFKLERNVIFIGATDGPGLQRGIDRLLQLVRP